MGYRLPEGTTPSSQADGTSRSTVSALPLSLNVPIPGLQFSQNIISSGGFIEIPYLAQYIAAVYNYLLGIVVIAAAVMIVFGGFKYILSSTASGIRDGKEVIKDAIIGLIVALGMITIMQAINPALVGGHALKVLVIDPIPLDSILRKGDSADLNTYNSIASGQTPPNMPACPGNVPKPANPAGINSWDRMQAACGKDLKSVVQVWFKEAIENGGAAYIRGGTGGGKSLSMYFPQTGFMVSQLYRNAPAQNAYNYLRPDTISACGIDSSKLDYNGDETKLQTPELRDADKAVFGSNGKNIPQCYALLKRDYIARDVDPIRCNNMLGTDCGLFVSQVWKCAGKPGDISTINYKIQKRILAETAQTGNSKPDLNEGGKMNIYTYVGTASKSVTIDIGGGKTKSIQVSPKDYLSKAACEKVGTDCKTDASYSGANTFDGVPGFQKLYPGKIQFGAAISFLCGGVGHFIMFTGGVGLPYEIIESGGRGTAVRKDKSMVVFPDVKNTFKYGMSTTDTLANYLAGAGCTSGQMWFVNP